MSINYKEKAILGIYWMSIMSISNIVIKLLITMVLSRLLSSYEFGVVAAIQIVISFADIFWMLGVGAAIVQKKVLTNDDITTGNTLNITFGLSIYSLIFVFASAIANFIGLENIVMLRVLAVVFVIHSISGVSESLLQKEMDFKSIGIINILALFIYGISASLLALLNFGVWSLIIAQLLQVLVKTILSIFRRPIKISLAIRKKSAKELMYFGTGFTLSKVFNNIANQGDYFVVNRTLGVSALGFYNRSYQLLMIPTNIIGTVMDQVLFPLLSKYQEVNEKLRYVFFNINALIALIAFPVTIISLTMSTELVYIVLGNKWDSTIVPFKILIISLFFRMAYKICDSLVRSLGAVYKRLWIQIIYAITIITGAFMGKEWGINGVAVAVTTAIIINYILMTLLIMHMIKFKITSLISYLLPIIIVSGLIGGLSYLISPLIMNVSGAFLRLVMMTLFVVLLYFISFKYVIIRVLPKDFKEFVATIIETTFKKIKLRKTR
jgi:O-antigen/teichoic acid export membrane protein